jgi:hypothetical protein
LDSSILPPDEDLCELIGKGQEVGDDHVVPEGLAQDQQIVFYSSVKNIQSVVLAIKLTG